LSTGLSRFFRVSPTYFFDEAETERDAIPAEVALALRDDAIRDIALRSAGLSERSLKVIADTNDALLVPLPRWIASELSRRPELPVMPCEVPWTGSRQGTAYAMAAFREETRRVATAAEGTCNDTLNLAAFNLGQLVAASLLPAAAVTTSLASAAAHAGLPQAEARRTIRSGPECRNLRGPRRFLSPHCRLSRYSGSATETPPRAR
jgi:hypothetical protein